MINFPVVGKTELAPGIKKLVVEAPSLAAKAKPGQFVVLHLHAQGERIPLTIADFDREEGTITLIFQEVGLTTFQLGSLEPGDTIRDIAGPLGRPSRVDYFGKVLCVGGGVGCAPLYPIARALREQKNDLAAVVGARSREFLILRKEMEQVCSPLIIATDDGSEGLQGTVLRGVEKYFREYGKPDYCVCIGPPVMMEAVCSFTRNYKVKTVVSLNPIMVDGTGMCGACRVVVGGEVKFACVDGPEFDGHLVDWELFRRRLQFYKREEKLALGAFLRKSRSAGER
ncbi:MAG: Sulfide dehydrogenase (Flavoprotein) subunit SudB [Thermoanaerobacterales bacterium 50_218]|nr:MAG: Sulfide dehydrogenase (Flavoprotein) subunit SudB [Thermoanaerobacterales bacterium 50_218]HAA90466.1 sulfide/dihydroorotate dehydrogenase-like FAD/NAD-binding protein [Peptococcaceae bacterium]